MKIRVLPLVFLLFFLLSACGGSSSGGEEPGPEASEPAQKENPAEPETGSETGTEAEPEEEPEAQPPEEEPEPEFLNPLTGLPISEEDVGNRPIAVMLNNIKAALPQYGISSADIIYEVPAEGGITRMLAIYQSVADVGNIGSVRSTRPYYLDLAQGWTPSCSTREAATRPIRISRRVASPRWTASTAPMKGRSTGGIRTGSRPRALSTACSLRARRSQACFPPTTSAWTTRTDIA
jgi:hypothetical protein